MYFCVVFCVALLGAVNAYSEEFISEHLSASDRECLEELGLDVKVLIDSVSEDFLIVEGNPDINKLYDCAFKKLKFINETTSAINFDMFQPFLIEFIDKVGARVQDKKQTAQDGMDACRPPENAAGDPGEKIVKFSNCYTNYLKRFK